MARGLSAIHELSSKCRSLNVTREFDLVVVLVPITGMHDLAVSGVTDKVQIQRTEINDTQIATVAPIPESAFHDTPLQMMPSTLALKPHVRLLLAVLALIGTTVHSSESGCQAASPFCLLADYYSPPSNIAQAALIDVDLNASDTAMTATTPSCTKFLTIYDAGGHPALSTTIKAKMYDGAGGGPLNQYQMFHDYYGEGRRPC